MGILPIYGWGYGDVITYTTHQCEWIKVKLTVFGDNSHKKTLSHASADESEWRKVKVTLFRDTILVKNLSYIKMSALCVFLKRRCNCISCLIISFASAVSEAAKTPGIPMRHTSLTKELKWASWHTVICLKTSSGEKTRATPSLNRSFLSALFVRLNARRVEVEKGV